MAPSILSRKRDLIYLIFFTIHIPIVFCKSPVHYSRTRKKILLTKNTSETVIDIYPLYPPSLIPSFLTTLRTWYIKTYADKFFISPPAWFIFYTWMELLYHVPLSLWAIQALWKGHDDVVEVQLLVYAVQTGATTGTCIADMVGWESVTAAQKWELANLYVPYLMLSVGMGWDMYLRLRRRLARVAGGKKVD